MHLKLHGWQVLEIVEQMSVKHPKSSMYVGKHTYASSLLLSWRKYSRHAARGSVPFLPDFSPVEYEPRIVSNQNPLSIGIWKGLN